MVGFVHLHMHSAYSLLEGALPIARLAELAKADHQPALALTDTDNMFGALEFSDKMAGSGIQPIIGCALSIDCGDQDNQMRPGGGPAASAQALPRLVLLAATEAGYRNLLHLNSRAFLDHPGNEPPHIKLAWLDGHADGLDRAHRRAGRPDRPRHPRPASRISPPRASTRCSPRSATGSMSSCSATASPQERTVEPALIDLAYAKGIPLVATNEPFFATVEDYEAHDALLCIAEGRVLGEADRRHLTIEHRFKTRAEMIGAVRRPAGGARLHRRDRRALLVPPGGAQADPAALLARRAAKRSTRRANCASAPTKGSRAASPTTAWRKAPSPEQYHERLAFELGVIERMNYSGYFLIVADFIQWAKSQGIPVGPGRGSGAGSLVAFSLTITDLDPIRFGLIFERFLNPDRVSMPDFDIDFCQNRRDEVIRYVQSRYGRDQVAQIITFGSLQARGVLRDVGRVLEMPYGQVDKLCKLVPQNPAAPVTLSRAIADEPRLQAERDSQPIVARAFAIAQKLEGLYRHASTHAAGIVIGDRPLSELVPLYRDPKSNMPVTQFNMKWVEQAGLVKFDFLGLKTLTVLETAVKLVAARGVEINLSRIPLDDAKTYREPGPRRDRRGVPGGKPGHAAGPRRHAAGPLRGPDRAGRALPSRPDGQHPHLLRAQARPRADRVPASQARSRSSRRPTASSPIRSRCSRSPATSPATASPRPTCCAAPWARRSRPRWRRSATASSPARSSAASTRPLADTIFDACAKFAEYGFNKSHSAPYAFITYQTAYMKANHPVEFLAASMTLDMGNTDKLAEFRERGAAPRHQGPAALGQPLRRRFRRRRQCHPLRARGAQGRRARRGRGHRLGAQRARRSRISPTSRAASIRAPSTSGCWKASPPPARSTISSATAPAPSPRWTRCSRPRSAPSMRVTLGQSELFGGPAAPEKLVVAGCRAVAAGGAAAARIRRHRLLPVGPSARRLCERAQEHAGAVLGGVLAPGEVRRHRRQGRRHRGVAGGAAHQDRQQDGDHRPVGLRPGTTRR